MNTKQFISGLDNFKAVEMPVHLTGCTGIFWLYNLNTNIQIGKLYDDGNFEPAYTGCSLSPNELKEIAALGLKIRKETNFENA